jgi:hypothetical protein
MQAQQPTGTFYYTGDVRADEADSTRRRRPRAQRHAGLCLKYLPKGMGAAAAGPAAATPGPTPQRMLPSRSQRSTVHTALPGGLALTPSPLTPQAGTAAGQASPG